MADNDQNVYVKLPDGNYRPFPRGTSPEVIQRSIAKDFPNLGEHSISGPPTGVARAKSAAYTYGEKGLKQLPLAGGILGGLAFSGTGPGAVLGAAGGGSAAEGLRQVITKMLGWEDAPQNLKESVVGMVKEGAIQAINEGTGRLASVPVKAFGKTMAETSLRGLRIPLLPSQAGVKGSLPSWGEKFLANAIPSGGIMREFTEKQTAKALEELGKEIEGISRFKGSSEQMGEFTQKAIETYRERYKKEVINPAYDEIKRLVKAEYARVPVMRESTSSVVDEFGNPMTYARRALERQQVGGVAAETRTVKQIAIPLLRQLREQRALIDPKLLADSESILASIIKAPKQVPFEVMQHSRSDLLAISRKLEEVLPGKRAGIVRQLIGGLDSSLERAADNSGIPKLGEKVREANRLTFENHRRFEQQLVRKVLDSSKPEQISGFVRKAGLQEIRDIQGMLTPPQQRMMAAQVAKDLIREGMDASGTMSPYQFAKKFDAIGAERGKQIFGAAYPGMKQLADTLLKLGSGKTGDISAASLHNWSFMAAGPSALVAMASGHPDIAAATAGALGAETMVLRGFARAITNPAKSAKVARLTVAAIRGAPYAGDALRRLITSPEEDQLKSSHTEEAQVGVQP